MRYPRAFLVTCLLAGALSSLVYTQTEIRPASAVNGAGAVVGSLTLTSGNAMRISMATPTAPVITQDASGTLAAGVYKLALTAIDAGGGETLYPAYATCTVTAASDDACIATWSAVTGAVSYRIWISDKDGATPNKYWTVTNAVTKTITSLAMAGVVTPATLPASNTAIATSLFLPTQTTFPGSLVVGNGGALLTTSAPWPDDPLAWEANGSVAGQGNTLIGSGAGTSLTSGNGNTFVGYGAGRDATIATQSTFIGWNAGKLTTSAYHNTYIGVGAGENQTSGNYNTYVGTDVALTKVSGGNNAYFGTSAGAADQTGIGNTFLGSSTGGTAGNYNLFAGISAGATNAADQNLALGPFALTKTTSGTLNLAIGYESLRDNVTGSGSLAIGVNALQLSTSAPNWAIGNNTLGHNVSGTGNVGVGGSALHNSTGNQSTAVGQDAGSSQTTGALQSILGYQALYYNVGGSQNVALGWRAGTFQANGTTPLATTNNSVYIGYGANGFNDSDSNTIVIGHTAIGAGANTAVLGNASVTDVYFGSSSAVAKLHAAGAVIAAGTITAASTSPFSLTMTANNALVDTGVKWTFTDTSSAAGFLPFQILGGAAGATNLFSVSKGGNIVALGSIQAFSTIYTGSGQFIGWSGNTLMTSASNGTLTMALNNQTGFSTLNLGPVTGNTANGTLQISKNSASCVIATGVCTKVAGWTGSDPVASGAGTGTITITNAIPAGSQVFGLTSRVVVIIAGSDGIASWALGTAADPDAWGAALALAAGTTSKIDNFTVTGPANYTTTTSITLTGTGGKIIDSGTVAFTVYYINLIPISI